MRLWLIIGAIVAVVGAAAWLYHHGGDVAELRITAKEAATVSAVVEKKDEIRNNPPSVDAVIGSLLAGTF